MLDPNYLNNLLDHNQVDENKLKFDLYLTLLALNNKHFNNNNQLLEINILEDFLRKINNLKVKIQLKRKDHEIEELLTNIKTIYEQNKSLIDKYNEENLDIINILESKEPIDITNIIDKLTKLKITRLTKKETYDKLRTEIIDNIFLNDFYTSNNTFYMNNLNIPLDEFYEIFDYLLDINNYEQLYHNDIANTSRTKIISEIINKIKVNQPLSTNIPIILTVMFTKKLNTENINTTKFNIDNIKISELYSFANNNLVIKETAKWKNVNIPNDYLYQKIKIMITNGMYYFNNNIFTMELINDFKISILTEDLINFIKENINKAYL